MTGRSPIAQALVTAGLVAAAALHVTVTGQVLVPALAVLLALAGAVAGPRLALAQAAQALVLVATALLTFAALLFDAPLDPTSGGPKLQYVVASGTALLTVAGRQWMRDPEYGDAATWAVGLVVFYSCGRVLSPLYLPLVAAYLGLAWAFMAAMSNAGRHRSPRHVLVAVAMIGGSALLAGGGALLLRAAYVGANAFILSQVGGGEVGFGAGAFQLGSMDGMRSSDEVILRVHGPASAHFRGQAYSEYRSGAWLPPAGPVVVLPPGAAPVGVVTTVEFVSSDQERLFLPAESGAVAVRPAGLLADALGVPRPAGEPPEELRFDSSSPPRLTPVPPRPADLALDAQVAAAIGPLIDRWVAGAQTPRARVAAIQARLEQDYTYSLHYERVEDVDPVVQFMLDSRLGHCEYFASGMALAARYVGVPARVVTGFRSTETSPFGGHRIVRSRDAHAWVEVYLDGAWEGVDPSPQNSMEGGPTRAFLAGALDDLAVAWERVGPQVLVAVLLAIFVGLQIRTLLRNRKAPQVAMQAVGLEGPPDWLLPLLAGLANVGLVREPSEPVESFAARVRLAGRADAGALLGRYAMLRYGGRGDSAALARDVEAWLNAASPPPESSPPPPGPQAG